MKQQSKEIKPRGQQNNNFFISVGCYVLLSVIMFVVFILISCSPADAHRHVEWKCFTTGTVLDVDPWGQGIFVEFDSGCWVGAIEWTGREPSRGEYGTLYEKKSRNGNIYKWVRERSAKSKSVLKWQSIDNCFPHTDKTVLVKYANDVTITTAYVNPEKEWKLETNRDNASGGITVTTIKEWAILPN